MPSRYRRDYPRLKAEVVARIERGETLRAICASSGGPAETTVRAWARTDAAFGEALTAARRRATWRRLYAFDEAKAAAFLARARAGEPVNALIGQPGMPSRATYVYWNRTQGAFAEATFALRQRRDGQLSERGRGRRRVFDPRLADRIVARLWTGARQGLRLEDILTADPELPCWETMMRWRREQPDFDAAVLTVVAAKRAMTKPVPEARVEAVSDHIATGGSFHSLSRMAGGPSMGALRRWMRDPHFAAEVATACDWRDEWCRDQIEEAALRTPPGPIRQMERALGPLKRRFARLGRRPSKPLYPSRRGA